MGEIKLETGSSFVTMPKCLYLLRNIMRDIPVRCILLPEIIVNLELKTFKEQLLK